MSRKVIDWFLDWRFLPNCRAEKERAQLKAELDDVQGQIEHTSKTKVTNACKTAPDRTVAHKHVTVTFY